MRRSVTGFIRILCLFTFIFAYVSFTFAQETAINNSPAETSAALPKDDDDSDNFNKKNELTVWGGFAPKALSGLRESNFAQVAFRYSRRLATGGGVALKYTFDAIPLAVIGYDRVQIVQIAPNTFTFQRSSTQAYAFGITPFGLQVNFRRKSKVQPFVSGNLGLLIFNKSIPDDRSALQPQAFGTKLNFTPQGSAGIEFATDSGRSYIVGYRFQHISNNSRGNINPGFDHNMFFFGYTFKKW